MSKFFRNNGLSIVFVLLFILSIAGQIFFGIKEYNKDLEDYGKPPITIINYFTTGHFLESTFENWESEFLQMGLFVWLAIFLKQKGSSESKKFDGTDEVDKKPDPNKKDAPWPVKRGGIILTLYQNSLTIILLLLFLISFYIHFYGSFKDENEQLLLKGKSTISLQQYLTDSRFWFESFQNWQSEFLSIFAIIILSIYLRQKGSPQSKPVDAPHSKTGE